MEIVKTGKDRRSETTAPFTKRVWYKHDGLRLSSGTHVKELDVVRSTIISVIPELGVRESRSWRSVGQLL